MLSHGPTEDGGLGICLQLPEDQIELFSRLIFLGDQTTSEISNFQEFSGLDKTSLR